MANLSDAWGTVTVKGVGKEFLAFAWQTTKNYYPLCDASDLLDVEPAEDIEFTFSTYGRWSFSSSLSAYLDTGENWRNKGIEEDLYQQLCKAIAEKDGSVTYEYFDCDPAMDWMGKGIGRLSMVDGQVHYYETFKSEDFTIAGYMELNDVDEEEAVISQYGEDVWEEWHTYTVANPEPRKSFEEWFRQDYDFEEVYIVKEHEK